MNGSASRMVLEQSAADHDFLVCAASALNLTAYENAVGDLDWGPHLGAVGIVLSVAAGSASYDVLDRA